MQHSRIIGSGAYLPEKVVTNDELARRLDTSDEWIAQRTGIRARHIAAPGELTSDMAVCAAVRALDTAGLTPFQIDLIVVATSTPDETFPASATRVQDKLGAANAAAFDVQAVCTGFVYALAVADNFIKVGQARRALVIGAETFSRILDWEDRSTCVLFGDGAGAVTKKNAGRAVLPIQDPRKRFGPDDQRPSGLPNLDKIVRHRQRVNETGTDRLHIESGRVGRPQLVLHPRSRSRKGLVRGARRHHDQVNLEWGQSCRIKCPNCRADRHVRRKLAGRGDMPGTNPGPLGDPFIGSVEPARQLVVGHNLFRQVGATANDSRMLHT